MGNRGFLRGTTEEPTTAEPAAADGELSEGLAEYVVKDAASYNNLESSILPALEDEIDHMTTITFPAMERLEVPGVYQYQFIYWNADQTASTSGIVMEDENGEVCVIESQPIESTITVCP